MTKLKILFVCLGNICRSPLAEAIFKTKISKKSLDHRLEADSCGTSNYNIGELPDHRTIANAKKNGVIIDHRGKQLSQQDLVDYDFIVAMDQSNYQDILRLAGSEMYANKIALMRSFDMQRDGDEVPDPYYGSEQEFQEVFEILDRSIDSFIHFLEREHLKA